MLNKYNPLLHVSVPTFHFTITCACYSNTCPDRTKSVKYNLSKQSYVLKAAALLSAAMRILKINDFHKNFQHCSCNFRSSWCLTFQTSDGSSFWTFCLQGRYNWTALLQGLRDICHKRSTCDVHSLLESPNPFCPIRLQTTFHIYFLQHRNNCTTTLYN